MIFVSIAGFMIGDIIMPYVARSGLDSVFNLESSESSIQI